MTARRLRLCLVAFNAYPAVHPEAGGQVGGTETRAWMLARHLAKFPELEVSLAVRTTGPISSTKVEGVQIVAMRDRFYRLRETVGGYASRRPGFPWVQIHRWTPALLWQIPLLATARLLEPRPTDPRQPMSFFEQIDADLFCCFGNQATAATAIASAHATGRPAVLFIGSDDDLNPGYTADSPTRNPYGDTGATCHYSLTRADAVLTQTSEQRQLLLDRFGRESTVIPNPIDLDEWDTRARTPLPSDLSIGADRFVLWMGRAEKIHKRPQTLLEVARLCPSVPFVMLLNPRDPAVDAEIRQTAPPNVRIITQVPFPLMPALFQRAFACINTSALEGFPNAFLQAAASRVPIVSLEVAANFLQESQAGVFVGGELPRAADTLTQWMNDTALRQSFGDAGRAYVEAHHRAEHVARELAEQLRTVSTSHSPPPI